MELDWACDHSAINTCAIVGVKDNKNKKQNIGY